MSRDRWSPRDRIAISVAVFALALLVRLLHVWSIADARFFPLRMGDAAHHHEFGLAAAEGDWLGTGVLFHAPLYPYFLGVVYTLVGSDALIVRSIQAVLGAFSCVFTAQAAGRLFGRREAIVAGVMLAVYGPAIFYDTIFHDSVLDLFFAALVLWSMVEVVLTRRTGALLAAGLALGGLSLTRENGIILLVPLLGWLVLERSMPARRRAVSVAIVLAGVALALTPQAIRDAVMTGRVASGDQFRLGINLYIGNNPDADGYYRPIRQGRGNPRFEMQDAIAVAERNAGRELTEAEVADYWLGQTFEYIREQPGDWLRLMARKTALGVNTAEPPDTEGPYTYMEHSPILAVTATLFGFGTLLALAVLGVFVTWPERRRLALFYLLPPIYLASVIAFLIFGRYRHAVAPYLILLAAPALAGLRACIRDWRRPRIAAGLATSAGVLLFTHLPIGSTRAEFRAHTHANIGAALEERGDLEGAAREYLEAIRIDPGGAQANQFLGNLLRRVGRPDAALAYLERAVEHDPTAPGARNDYGAALAALGREDDAREQLGRALSLDPALVPAHLNLGTLDLRAGAAATALTRFRAAVEIAPDDPQARRLLVTALVLEGELAAGLAHADTLARLATPEAAADIVLAVARDLVEGRALPDPRPERALAWLREARGLVPRDIGYYRVLAAAHAGTGDFDGAVEAAGAALEAFDASRPEALGVEAEGSLNRSDLEAELERYRNRESATGAGEPGTTDASP